MKKREPDFRTYEWREGARVKGDAVVIGEALDALAKRLNKHLGGLSAKDVVEAAQANHESPLGQLFTWNRAKAAQAHWEWQARIVLQSIRVRIVSEDKEQVIIGRVAVKIEGQEDRLYVPTERAAKEKVLRDQMIAAAKAGLEGWRKRYEQLEGFDEVLALIDAAIKAIEQKANAKKAAHKEVHQTAVA